MGFKGFAGIVGGLALLAGLSYGVDSCAHMNYSNGGRVGVVNKFSSKGFIFKTYEGTLALEGQQLKEWRFSVDTKGNGGKSLEDLAQEIQTALDSGKTVKLSYVQPFKKWLWEGETEYSVVDIDPIQEPSVEHK